MASDVCVPLSRLAECIRESKADLDASGLQGVIVGHVGDGNFHIGYVVDPNDRDEIARAIAHNDRMVLRAIARSEEHTSELQSLMRISYAVFCLKKKKTNIHLHTYTIPYNKVTVTDRRK